MGPHGTKIVNMCVGKRMKVLFVMLQMEMGGSERLVHNLARSLDRSRFDPSIAWFHGERILPEFLDLHIPLYHVPKVSRVDWQAMRTIGDIIRENKIHVVNAHHFMPLVYSFYGSKIKSRAKLLYTEHSEWELKRLAWKWKKAGGYLLNHADGAIGVSSAVSKQIRSAFNTHNVTTILNGVDLTRLNTDDKEMLVKRALGIQKGDIVIGIVANLKKIKNHIFLLKTFYELAQDLKNVKLLLIGQGFQGDPDNSETEIRDFIDRNRLKDSVFLLGHRSDIPSILKLIDIFCLTSFKEGLPMSLIEAMAAGIPVVGSDVEGIRDVIIPNKNGFLVATGDITALKKTLFTLATDDRLRKTIGQEGRRLADKEYSLRRCVQQYETLFSAEK